MARGRRIADVAPRRIVAALVLKDTLENEEFFAAEMRVRREGGAWRVANDGRCARDLVTDAVEHSALNTRHRRAHPGPWCGMDRGALGEVGIDPHHRLRLPPTPGVLSREGCCLAVCNGDQPFPSEPP